MWTLFSVAFSTQLIHFSLILFCILCPEYPQVADCAEEREKDVGWAWKN